MADNNEKLNILLEMGFNEKIAKKAISLNPLTIQDAMEWLIEHSEDPVDDAEEAKKPDDTIKNEETSSVAAAAASTSEIVQEAHSLKCDECGKLLKDADAATAHAYKTNHSSFSESVEAIKPRTAEEIEAAKKNLQDKLIKMRAERTEKEKQDEIEREKMRRKQGREIHEIRQKHDQDEMKRIAEEKRKEKKEAEAHKQRVRDQIAQDREDNKRRQLAEQQATVQQTQQTPPPIIAEKRSYEDCKIQVRLTDGKTIGHTFKAKEQLAAVRLWIEINRTDEHSQFSILQPFPRKQYTEDDMMRTLEDLGLVPASNILITRKVV